MWSETAASVTSRCAAASLTEPRRTTAEYARNWVGVTALPSPYGVTGSSPEI